MTEDGTPIKTKAWAPAALALALATAFAVAAAGIGPASVPPAHAQAQQDETLRGLPIIRDTEIEQLLRDYAAPILRAAGLAKQNVKSSCSATARSTPSSWTAATSSSMPARCSTPRPRTRSSACSRTRPATSPAAIMMKLREQLATAQTASIVGHAARRRRHGGGRAQRRRRRQYRRGGDHGAAVGDPALAARLCAHPGRPGRPRRREVPHRHRPVAQGHAASCSSASPTSRCSIRATSIPICKPTRCRPNASPRSTTLAKPAPIWTARTRPNCNCATT